MSDWSIKLDNVELVNSTYNVSRILDDTTPEREINLIETAGVDGAVIVSDRFSTKLIRIEGTLIGTSASDLQGKIDTLNELFARKNVNFDILPPSGVTRRYVVRLMGAIEYRRQFFHNDYVPFIARLFVAEGVGKATSSTNAHTDQNTGAERRPAGGSDTATFEGSATPKPIIKFVLDTIGKLDLITFTDDDNSKEMFIEIDTNFANTDIVKVDFADQSVKRERAGVDTVIPFRGEFPDFVIGDNDFHIDFQGATYVEDQTQTSHGSGAIVGNNGAGITRMLAQSFVPSESGYLAQMKIWAKKTGTPPSNLTVKLYTDNGGRPDVNLGNVFTEPQSTFGGTDVEVTLNNGVPLYVRKGVKYWLVFTTGDSGGDYFILYGSGGAPGTDNYTNGELLNYDGSTANPPADPDDWEDYTGAMADLYFKTYQGQGGAIDWVVDVDIDYVKRYL